MSMIKDASLAESGSRKIDWVKSYMPILAEINDEFIRVKPFAGMKIAMSVHMEAKTAYLAQTLHAGGAEVHASGCNPLSVQDDVAAALSASGVDVNAVYGANEDSYISQLKATLSCSPDLIIDDGGDLTHLLHEDCKSFSSNLIGGCEETTTGIHRLKAREKAGKLLFPMINVNDADCKHLFDNRYGTGQSALEGIMRTTNLIVAGKTVVVAGYGWCGKGVAMRAKGLGALVVVTEIDPVKAIEAVMDGFRVMPMNDAAKIGDIFITVTGCCDVIRREHMMTMKDGAIMCNSGHFDCEIDKKALEELSEDTFDRRMNIKGYRMKDGRVLNLLAEGRLVNLAAGDGHPAEIMDMSFALQAKCLEFLSKSKGHLQNRVYDVPQEIDRKVAFIKLGSLGSSIDSLNERQKKYLEEF
jgi:adenosylhomocysteinase